MSQFAAQKIVVPIDFSDDSARAVTAAMEISDDPQNVHVLHVLFPLDTVGPGAMWGHVDDESRRAAVEKSFGELFAKHDWDGVKREVRIGDPGLIAVDYAKEIGADLIVIPSHGYHGVKRLVLGSVTERVIRHAACSVLVLRRSDAE